MEDIGAESRMSCTALLTRGFPLWAYSSVTKRPMVSELGVYFLISYHNFPHFPRKQKFRLFRSGYCLAESIADPRLLHWLGSIAFDMFAVCLFARIIPVMSL